AGLVGRVATVGSAERAPNTPVPASSQEAAAPSGTAAAPPAATGTALVGGAGATMTAAPVTVVLTVIHDGESQTVTTTATTVAGVLAAAQVPVHPLDQVTPALTAPVATGITVRLVRVTQTISYQRQTVSFTATSKNSNTVEMGMTETAQSGRNGSLEKVFTTTYHDGKAVGTALTATKTLVAMRQRITLVGTGQPNFVNHGNSATGAASWYPTIGLHAASPNLPFGTVVHVINLVNGRTINVKIEDRGPYAGQDRIIDLSPTAFAQLDPLGTGIVSVKLEW
ncbi:MAG TPA: RlpA-like double-psi beta-barrel domain-containing protein, partial [Actinomycetota bacterium]|nr:RlpA-like double-psi beta-barrel domain-containing protein [Actinomycetota bacterium]